ncbi:DnaJ domain-containing protein, partial [Leptodontidium sp. MPI-SDFR-AT-0119]
MGFVDHYQILRLALSASDTEIKHSYQKLSLAFHPDKNKSPEATATFQLIGESYAVLKDKDKRAAYD